jgi:hypothetical protein
VILPAKILLIASRLFVEIARTKPASVANGGFFTAKRIDQEHD